jgi:hypothetical protein
MIHTRCRSSQFSSAPDSDIVFDETVGGRVETATVTPRFTAADRVDLPKPTAGKCHPDRSKTLPDEIVPRADCVDTDSEHSGDLGTNDLGMDRCRTHTPLRTLRKACPNSGYFIVFGRDVVTSVSAPRQVPADWRGFVAFPSALRHGTEQLAVARARRNLPGQLPFESLQDYD